MPTAFLADRGVVKVVGDDARGFLQGLVTCDVAALAPGDARLGALLTPQGKIIADFILVEAPAEDGGGFFLDCPLALAPDLMRRLNLYKLRAKVIVEDISEVAGVAASWDEGEPAEEAGLAYRDPRPAELGWRLLCERNRGGAAATAAAAAYHARRIGLGIPEGGKDFVFGDTFPHEADMDALGGVDFKKGCFIGQEVVSRMQHRGSGGRTRIVPVVFEGGFAATEGSEVFAGEKPLGFIGSQANGRALAKLRLDRVADALAVGTPLVAGGIPLEVLKPAWAPFDVPGAAA